MLTTLKKIVQSRDSRWSFFNSIGHHKRILELGCGYGFNCITLKNLFPEIEIHGIDLLDNNKVPDFIEYKRIDLDVELLPYPGDFFDAIVFTHVIEHLRCPMRLGKEINRVLRRGGKIYIETPNWTTVFVPSFGFKREQHGPFNFFDDPTHIKPWSKHGLFEFLSQTCKLRVKRVGTVRNWLRVPSSVFSIPVGIIKGKRGEIITALWNLYGWCIYGIGIKE